MLTATLFAAVVALPTQASADAKLWLGGYGSNLNTLGEGGQWGAGGQLGGQLEIANFWFVFADLGASHHFANVEQELAAETVTSVAAGLRYDIDIFKYVPYVGLGVVGYLDAPSVAGESLQPNLGAKLILGLDWRFDRHWSLGFHGELHGRFLDFQNPIYSNVGLNLGYHFRL